MSMGQVARQCLGAEPDGTLEVLAHAPHRPFGVTAAQRFQDLRMLPVAVGGGLPVSLGPVALGVAPSGQDAAHQPAPPRCLVDREVEALMSVPGRHAVADLTGSHERGEGCRGLLGRPLVEACGGLAHRQRLQVEAAEVGVLEVGQAEFPDSRHATWLEIDEIEGRESADGLAHRHHAHAQAIGEFLQPQWSTRRDALLDDGVEEGTLGDIGRTLDLRPLEHPKTLSRRASQATQLG